MRYPFVSTDKANWTARVLRWTYCAIVGWTAVEAFSTAHAAVSQNFEILAVAQFVAAAAFLFRSLEIPALAVLIAAFAIIAGVLAGVGLYCVLSTAVRQRTPEIGIRMAMGAVRGDIVQLIVTQGLRLSAVGIAAGIVAAFFLGRVMTAMLVGVKPTDPETYAVMTVVFLAISAVACWLPAMRAAGLDPKTALHEN